MHHVGNQTGAICVPKNVYPVRVNLYLIDVDSKGNISAQSNFIRCCICRIVLQPVGVLVAPYQDVNLLNVLDVIRLAGSSGHFVCVAISTVVGRNVLSRTGAS